MRTDNIPYYIALSLTAMSLMGGIILFGPYIFIGVVALFTMCGAIGFINNIINNKK